MWIGSLIIQSMPTPSSHQTIYINEVIIIYLVFYITLYIDYNLFFFFSVLQNTTNYG